MNPAKPAAPGALGRARFPMTLPGVLIVVAIYALVHATTRLLSSGNLGEDDTFDNLLIQTLAPGYSVHTGPLYDWLLWGLQRILGTGIQAFLLLKYALLVSMAGCIFLITRRLTGSPLWAFIAVESMATVYQIFWRFHEGFTHRVGAMALALASFLAITRLIDKGGWQNYLLFAVLAALGLLSEHSYAFFLFATLAAAALQPAMRRRLFSAPMLACLPIALLIVSPYLLWLLADPARASALLADYYPITPVNSLPALWASLRDAVTFPILVLSPYIVIAPLVFPGMLQAIFKNTPLRPRHSAKNDFSMLLTHLLLIEFVGLIASGLLFSRSGFAVHSILPMFVIALVWLTEKARQSAPSQFRIKLFMMVLLAFTITAYSVRFGNLFVYEPFCSRCRWGVPYDDLADRLRQLGFNDGTLISNDDRIAGNLRRYFPSARFTLSSDDIPLPPATGHAADRVAVVWSVDGNNVAMPPDLRSHVDARIGALPPTAIVSPWQHGWKTAGYRKSTWAAVVAAPAPAADGTPGETTHSGSGRGD